MRAVYRVRHIGGERFEVKKENEDGGLCDCGGSQWKTLEFGSGTRVAPGIA